MVSRWTALALGTMVHARNCLCDIPSYTAESLHHITFTEDQGKEHIEGE
jgi:hypothetical protein